LRSSQRLKGIAGRFHREFRLYRLLAQHPRTPKIAKALFGFAFAYFCSPIDLIPDFIPVIGHLDDVVIVPVLILAALRFIPDEVLAECKAQA
jgi:uncharacterized membrane protein YkvA (DUF1232 family)